MEIPIVFESVEGQTRKISEFLGQRIRTAGHVVRRHCQNKFGGGGQGGFVAFAYDENRPIQVLS